MEVTYELVILLIILFLCHLLVLAYVIKKPKKSIKDRHVVVTGGSSGIGLWSAINCIKLGANVTIIARNVTHLEKAVTIIKGHRINDKQKVIYKSIDLSKDYDKIKEKLTEIETDMGDIYMLVNCAGMAICGVVEDFTIDNAKLMMDINYFATFYPTHYVLGKMKAKQEGIIVITASQAALLGIYGYGAYAASKFALRGFAETLYMETKHKNVSVTLALPADTNTPGFENEEKTKPMETKIISGSGGLANPEDVAAQIIDDALRGTFFSILGAESWVLTILCCGMAPWNSFFLNTIQILLMGPLRFVGIILQWNFRRIIRNCDEERQSNRN